MSGHKFESLNQLNFDGIIKVDSNNIDHYSFNKMGSNHLHHIIGYCTLCDDTNYNEGIKGGQLNYMSHGSHSSNFLEALEITDTNGWSETPVMFILENPSLNYIGKNGKPIYKKINDNPKKTPTQKWYWVHSVYEASDADKQLIKAGDYKYFQGHYYGTFIASAICRFKLKNAYATNLVKCGINITVTDNETEKDKYYNTKYYKDECIEECTNTYLKREIEILNPKIIFTLGKRVSSKIEVLLDKWGMNNNNIKLVPLLHPAAIKSKESFKKSHHKNVLEALKNNNIVSEDLYNQLNIDNYQN